MRECDQPAPYFNHIHLSKGDQRCQVAICNEGEVIQREISVVYHKGLFAIESRCKQPRCQNTAATQTKETWAPTWEWKLTYANGWI